jgi:hypothetical protein
VECSCEHSNEPSGSIEGGENSCLAKRLLASQEGFCSMELVINGLSPSCRVFLEQLIVSFSLRTKSPPVDSILKQISPFHIFAPYFYKIHFNITIPLCLDFLTSPFS